MKALSGYAEWFWLIAKNWKDIENRNWSLARYSKTSQLPARVYLHASKTPTSRREINFIRILLNPDQLHEFDSVDWSKYRGCIIGEVTITGQVTAEDVGHPATHSPWFFGTYGFVVKDGILYDHPIPCRGQLGFFQPDLASTV